MKCTQTLIRLSGCIIYLWLVGCPVFQPSSLKAIKQPRFQVQVKNTVNYEILRKKYHIPEKFGNCEIDSVISISKSDSIPEHIAFNLIFQESRFDSTVSDKIGCNGYLQLNPRYFSFTNRFDNLRKGYGFLTKQYKRLGTWEKALVYYNSGSKMIRKNNYINYILNHGT